MIAFDQWVDSSSLSILFVAINVAVAATIIAALALIISRLRMIGLPVRHAFCVFGVAGGIMTPLLVLSLKAWTPGIAEIRMSEWPAKKRTSSELNASRQALTQNGIFPDVRSVDHPTTESHGIDVPKPQGSIDDSISADSEDATTTTTTTTTPTLQSNAISSVNFGIDRIDYRLILGKVLILIWFIGSVVFLLRRVSAEIRLRKWLVTCNPIADVETLQAAQSAAFFVGLHEESPLRRLAVQFRLRRWLGRRDRIIEAETLEALQSAANVVGLNERPCLLRSKILPAPVVCGVLHPKLILPEAMANGGDGLSHDQLVAVLTHEMAHLARRDLVASLCLTIARIFYWWNPLFHVLCNRIDDMGEQICDDIATSSLSQPREYATALLHFAERSTNIPPQAASLGLSVSTVSQLEIRIRRILHSTRSKCLRVNTTACVIVVLMAMIVSATASMIQIRAAADETPATSVLAVKVESNQTDVGLGVVDELSDANAIGIDAEWGSVCGRIQVTNPDKLDLRPRKQLAAGRKANFAFDIIVNDDLLVDPQSGGLEGAFVYLAKAPATIHPEAARVPITSLIVDQPRGQFAPHLMIVRVGRSVEWVNTSAIAANIHIYPLRNQAMNLMLRASTNPGAGQLWTLKKAESLPMKVASDLHPWMKAYWLVLDHPYASTSTVLESSPGRTPPAVRSRSRECPRSAPTGALPS